MTDPAPTSACTVRGGEFTRITHAEAEADEDRDPCRACFGDDHGLADADALCIAPHGHRIHQTRADAGGTTPAGGMTGTKPSTVLNRDDVTTIEEAREAMSDA